MQVLLKKITIRMTVSRHFLTLKTKSCSVSSSDAVSMTVSMSFTILDDDNSGRDVRPHVGFICILFLFC